MVDEGFALFETAIGHCGIVWGGRGILGVVLPEVSERETRVRLQRRFAAVCEAQPPPEVQRAIEAIVAHLRGESRDLGAVQLDLGRLPDFDRCVYEVARTIPPGATLTYGEVAARLGDANLAREVGQALARNPFTIVVPCHRVLAAGGKPGGFSATGGISTKLRLLSIEGATAPLPLPLFDDPPGPLGAAVGQPQ